MGKARIETRPRGRATKPRELAALLRASLTIAAALCLVLLLDALGAIAAIDEGLQRRYVRLSEALGASRETTEPLVVVASDSETIEAWGPPPWPAERLAELVERISVGNPNVIAELGHVPMFEPGEALDRILESHAGELLTASTDEQSASPWSGIGLDHGELVLGPNSRLHALAEHSERLPTMPERLAVHWLTPSSRLPVVPAHQVAAGKIPSRTFAGRVVLLGMTDRDHAMPVETPVGLLSPVEVEAHALIGLADSMIWAELPLAWSYLGCALLGFGLLLMFSRTDGVHVALLVLGGIATLLVVDFVLYQRGVVRLGSARVLLSVATVSLGYWLSEATAACVALRRLHARVLSATSGTVANELELELDEHGFWQDLAELGSEYVFEAVAEFAGSTVLERVDDGWTLVVRASAKLDAESHALLAAREHLDIRRAPFRVAWLTLRASWTTQLLPRGPLYRRRKTLQVPLERDGELLGLWLVHLPDELELELADIETFERLGRQMADGLVRRRERLALRDQAPRQRLCDHVETIDDGLRLLDDEHRWGLELLEQLPVRALIATVWGELEFIDPRLRSDLARRYPGLFDTDVGEPDLRRVLARLTGTSLDEAQRLMRKVVQSDVAIELDTIPGIIGAGDRVDVWVLSRIRSKHGIDLPGFRPAVHIHILLMARSSVPAKTVETRSGALLRVLGGS